MVPKRNSTDYPPYNSRPTSPFFTANMSQQDIQEKIAVARREADALKDKIKATKDQTADTSRECGRERVVCQEGLAALPSSTHEPC